MEGATLAQIAKDGPITPYKIKEVYRLSPSAFWSGSAGAVYPMVQRLEKRGLIQSQSSPNDGRKRREYTITSLGKRVMLAWLSDAERAGGMGFDPLRTRLFFLDLLNKKQQQKFLQETEENLSATNPAPLFTEAAAKMHKLWERYRLNAFRSFIKQWRQR